MESDEQLYEIAAKELAESPRQGLLIKCMTNAGGNEPKGKALYIETRVEEMKAQIKVKAQEAEEVEKKLQAEKRKKEETLAAEKRKIQFKKEAPIVGFIAVVVLGIALYFVYRGL